MPNVTTSQIIINGERNAVVRLTCFSDGTAETDVVKIDATPTGPLGYLRSGRTFYPLTKLRVDSVDYDINGMSVRIGWAGAPSADMLILSHADKKDFTEFGGLPLPADVAGGTGSIVVSTAGAVAGSSYTLIVRLTKNIVI